MRLPRGLSDRDTAIVQTVGQFKYVSTLQIYALHFTTASRTPCYTVVNRLCELHYLRRIEREAPGGALGGAGQYVYALGRYGYALTGRTGSTRARWSPKLRHTLFTVDVYTALAELHKAGTLVIHSYKTEAMGCWAMIGGQDLRPDLFANISRGGSAPTGLWFEIDMGTEEEADIIRKVRRYWAAYQESEAWPVSRIVFVAKNDDIAVFLRYVLSKVPAEQRQLFSVLTLPELVQTLSP